MMWASSIECDVNCIRRIRHCQHFAVLTLAYNVLGLVMFWIELDLIWTVPPEWTSIDSRSLQFLNDVWLNIIGCELASKKSPFVLITSLYLAMLISLICEFANEWSPNVTSITEWIMWFVELLQFFFKDRFQ